MVQERYEQYGKLYVLPADEIDARPVYLLDGGIFEDEVGQVDSQAKLMCYKRKLSAVISPSSDPDLNEIQSASYGAIFSSERDEILDRRNFFLLT